MTSFSCGRTANFVSRTRPSAVKTKQIIEMAVLRAPSTGNLEKMEQRLSQPSAAKDKRKIKTVLSIEDKRPVYWKGTQSCFIEMDLRESPRNSPRWLWACSDSYHKNCSFRGEKRHLQNFYCAIAIKGSTILWENSYKQLCEPTRVRSGTIVQCATERMCK